MPPSNSGRPQVVFMLKQTTNASGSSKIQILIIFIESVPLKVGVANIRWVIYTLVSNIPTHV